MHKMRRRHAILISIVLYFIKEVYSNECIDVSKPNIRYFPTLLDLQANKQPFNVASPKFSGNYITIRENLNNLERNAFICYTSEYIIKMFLNNRQIKQIEEGAFYSLNCLMTLDLYGNSLSKITKYTFEGLVILHELNLGENNLTEIPELVFSLLPTLKVLNLTRNTIRVLHRDSFQNLSLLEQLDLSYNKLHDIVPEVLKYFRQLKNLQLGSNLFDRMDFEKWVLPTLRTLNLSNNVLESYDTSYVFFYGTTLKELYLDRNYLTEINLNGLKKHLPNLTVIDINYNPWSCPQLFRLMATLREMGVSFDRGTSNDNPNIEGIACNRSMDLYTTNKVVDVEIDIEPSSSTTSDPLRIETIEATMEKILLSNAEMLEAIKQLNIVVASLFVIVIVFILIDISVSSNLINCIRHARRRVRGDGTSNFSIENNDTACLLRDR